MKTKSFNLTIGRLKRCLILLLLLLLRLTPAICQEYQYVPFPDSNAVWSEVFWKPDSDPKPGWVYNKYALFNEDTIINGISYHKLFHTNEIEITKENSICIGGIREDSLKRVIANSSMFEFTPEVEEVILFDFSLSVGDTVWSYSGNDAIVPNLSADDKLVVIDVDTILLNNTKRRVIHFDIPFSSWIEGVGSTSGLVFPSGDLPTNGMHNYLLCMHQNDTLLYYSPGLGNGDYDGCVPSFVISDVALLPNTHVKVYPNPVTGESVNFENLDFETFELFDLNGNLIREEEIKGHITFKLTISGFPCGTYFYRLRTKGLVPTQGKLIIQ